MASLETPDAVQAGIAMDPDTSSDTGSSSDAEVSLVSTDPNLPVYWKGYNGHSILTVANKEGLGVPWWYYLRPPRTTNPPVQFVTLPQLYQCGAEDPNDRTWIRSYTKGVDGDAASSDEEDTDSSDAEDTDSSDEEDTDSSDGENGGETEVRDVNDFTDPIENPEYIPDRSSQSIFVLASRNDANSLTFLTAYLKMWSRRQLLCFLHTDGTPPAPTVRAIRTRIPGIQPFGF